MNAIAFLIAFVLTIAHDPAVVRWPPAGEFSAIVVSREMEPIPGATVSLTPCGKTGGATRTEVSGPSGSVAFAKVPPGEYVLAAELSGYARTQIGPVRSDGNPFAPELLVVLNPVMYTTSVTVDP
jgi:hypothetical protein